MQQNKFSLNIDEATSSNNLRVLALIVSFFCPDQQKIVIHHFDSISVIRVNSQTLFDAIDKLFCENNIPWNNLMSNLMDSCAVMRGSKSGLETRIRTKKAKHLLDIDGDTCHHAHIAAKRFCQPFDYHVEGLMSDVYSDFKWSVDHREVLQTICAILGDVKYTVPQRYISHRWLSVYDVCVDTIRLIDAYTIFFAYYIPKAETDVYKDVVEALYRKHNITSDNQIAIKKMFKPLLQKAMTKEGKERKSRIVEKLFYQRTKTMLIMQLYAAVLPHLKKYVIMFQSKETKVDKLHDEQKQLATSFLNHFIKPEELKGLTPKKLVKLDVSDTSKHLHSRNMFIGRQTRDILDICRDDTLASTFMKTVKKAYIQCSIAILTKMPINNILLRVMSAFDPVVRSYESSQSCLGKIPSIATNLIEKDKLDTFDLEVRAYTIDDQLPGPAACGDEKLDLWWAKVSQCGRYPLLSSAIKAMLSCFHGPIVEGTFNIMGDILNDTTASMKVETYSAIQTVKHELLSKSVSSVQMFFHKEPKYSVVDSEMCRNLQNAYRTSETLKAIRKTKKGERLKSCGVEISQTNTPVSKRKFHEQNMTEVIDNKKAKNK